MARKQRQFQPEILTNVHITDAGAEGKAIARVEGQVLFVPYAAPGDVADIQLTARKKQYLEGKIVRLAEASPLRTQALCRHFTLCGGCRWQHLSYETQLAQKQQQVHDAFARIGKFSFPPLRPIKAAPDIYYYRNKLEFTFADRKWFTHPPREGVVEDPRGLGFHLPGMFDRVIHLEECHLQAEPSNAIRLFVHQKAMELNLSYYNNRRHEGLLRNLLIRNSTAGGLMVILVSSQEDKAIEHRLFPALIGAFPQITSLLWVVNPRVNENIAGLEVRVMHGEAWLTELMEAPGNEAPLVFRIAPASFFQTNPRQAAVLYGTAFELAGLKGDEVVYDLYSGTGTISCYMARHCKKVVGVEYVEEAVADARVNARLNGLNNTEFVAGDLGKMFDAHFVATHGRPDVVITDPPRAGMHPKVVAQLLDLEPEKIVYVSCNPATQARDIALLTEKYAVTAVQPVDMFPQTHHVENVALLVRGQV
ncbi:MAG: 23S rRNA (uracil(1939)-C(5))-methyltransferase RlmD [Bacteroidetes bacterium]|nr:23S rRNA (uracil(1939)-C(5))-methyltransferase RlmD [Bacteroidota bacterium]